jgi:hypothetical protein
MRLDTFTISFSFVKHFVSGFLGVRARRVQRPGIWSLLIYEASYGLGKLLLIRLTNTIVQAHNPSLAPLGLDIEAMSVSNAAVQRFGQTLSIDQ